MIRFPQQHIADSVMARVMRMSQQARPQVQQQGQMIEQAVTTPPAAAAAPEGLDTAMLLRSLGL